MKSHLTNAMGLLLLACGVVQAETARDLGPVATAVSSDGRTLFVALADAKRLAVVGLPGGTVARTIDLPAEPTGVALSPDGRLAYVSCGAARSSVVELDAASGAVLATIPTGHTAMAPVVAPDGKRLYVCQRFDHEVSVIDLVSHELQARVKTVREPVAAALTPDGNELWVANLLPADRADQYGAIAVAGAVTVIDTRSLETASIRLLTGSMSLRGIAISPDGRYAVVAHILARYHLPTTQVDRGWMNSNALTVIDVASRKLVNTVLLDDLAQGAANPWGVAWTADGRWILVTHAGTDELSVIDGPGLAAKVKRLPLDGFSNVFLYGLAAFYSRTSQSDNAADVANDLNFLIGLRKRIKLPGVGPRGLAVRGSQVYVAEYFSDSVAVVELGEKSDVAVRPMPLGERPQPTAARRGERLFHDATLCTGHWQSCASCHPDGRADGLNWDLLNDDVGNPKNTKSLVWAHRTPPAMSVGVRETAEEAVRAGIRHILMAERPEEEAAAIDAYLKSLEPLPSPLLQDGKLSPAALRGQKLFESQRIGCARCHPAPLYTDRKSHDVGSRGRYEKETTFDTPTLVELWRTAPYLHDGRYTTVRELLAEGKHGQMEQLSSGEIDDLVEFVLSL